MKYFEFTKEDQQLLLQQAGAVSGIQEKALEKDLWVTIVLKAIFQTPYAEHLLFKGGTSLSKAWKIIERFSEDIDLSIDRAFHGFGEVLTHSQIKKLKRVSSEFTSTIFKEALEKELLVLGVPAGSFKIIAKPIPITMKDTVDPQELIIQFSSSSNTFCVIN